MSDDETETNLSEAEEEFFPRHHQITMVCLKKNINILILTDNIPEKYKCLLYKNQIYVVNENK